ncbi:MAG TPA: hypothetical protein ENJ97_04780 [Planctomycetes bacterium]|nr:hypothetical protein [Planctomycetota bacterium]
MRASLPVLLLPGAAAAAAGLWLLGSHRPPTPRVDPSPLGPAAQALQGPLAASRNFLIPLSLLEVDRLLREGRLEEGKRAALRLLAFAPWLQPVWIQVGWALAYSGWDDLPSPRARAERMARVEAWLALASRVLPADPDPPATLAFLLDERMPPRSPEALAWRETQGADPALEADQWLQEAFRRAPRLRHLLARRSAIALRLAGTAYARGDRDSCLSFLRRALSLETRLARQGGAPPGEWTKTLGRLRDMVARPRPWTALEIRALDRTAPGTLFLEAAGIRPP